MRFVSLLSYAMLTKLNNSRRSRKINCSQTSNPSPFYAKILRVLYQVRLSKLWPVMRPIPSLGYFKPKFRLPNLKTERLQPFSHEVCRIFKNNKSIKHLDTGLIPFPVQPDVDGQHWIFLLGFVRSIHQMWSHVDRWPDYCHPPPHRTHQAWSQTPGEK